MARFLIEGGHSLRGSISATGNKNAALPLLAAALLTDQVLHLLNVPDIGDVRTKLQLLEQLGMRVERPASDQLRLQTTTIADHDPEPALARRIRTSILLAGPLLARRGFVTLPRPGGDVIGSRRLDTHFLALQSLGAQIELTPSSYLLRTDGLRGADIFLDEMSVTGTEQAVLAAVLADGESTISNAASEPHVQDLCRCLQRMGAQIEGIGTNVLHIRGVTRLNGAEYRIGPDFMEVGSLIGLAAATRSELRIVNARPADQRMARLVFGRLGVLWQEQGEDILVPAEQELRVVSALHGAIPTIQSMPWPGFPSDLMSIALVLATQVQGTVLFHEKLFDGRLFFVDRLISMGARIVLCDPHRAVVVGPSQLYGEELASPDIRAGMALLIAALAARGRSVINNIHQIDRGYERIDQRLAALGAQIERVE